MSIKIEDRELRIPVEELFESLDAEARKRAAKLIGADAEAWRQMAEAVADPNDLFNADEAWWLDPAAMLKVRQALLPLMPEIAKVALRRLQIQLDEAKAAEERAIRWAWAMWHAHNNPDRDPWPKVPDWAPVVRAEMQVRDAAPLMREALRRMTQGDCPLCMLSVEEGHTAECIVGAALRAADPPSESLEET